MIKKLQKTICIFLVGLLVSLHAVQVSAYVETNVFEGVFSRIIYIVEGNAFFLSDEEMIQALSTDGLTVVLPEETAGKPVYVYALNELGRTSHWRSSDDGVVNDCIPKMLRDLDATKEEYILYFVSSDDAEYDNSKRIGMSSSSVPLLYYTVNNDRMVFLDQNEIDELNSQKILKIEDPKINFGDRINSSYVGYNDISSSSWTAEVGQSEYLHFSFTSKNETEYEIYVNYDNYKKSYIPEWYYGIIEFFVNIVDFFVNFMKNIPFFSF